MTPSCWHNHKKSPANSRNPIAFKHFTGQNDCEGARRGPIDLAFRSRPIEVHFISGQNLCRRRRLCVQQDIFWHLHGINQKRRRPPPRLYRYIYIYRVYICAIGIETEVGPSTFVAIYTTQLSLVGFQRGHLINNARKLCEIAFTVEFPGGVASCGQWRSWQGILSELATCCTYMCPRSRWQANSLWVMQL